MSIETAVKILEIEEGFSPGPYVDTEGYITIGIGKKISPKNQSIDPFLAFPRMPESVAQAWMREDLKDIVVQVSQMAFADQLNSVRAATIYSMVYQLGYSGFQGFVNTRYLLEDGNFEGAAMEMMDSLWARQTTNRAERHAHNIRTGVLHEYYR